MKTNCVHVALVYFMAFLILFFFIVNFILRFTFMPLVNLRRYSSLRNTICAQNSVFVNLTVVFLFSIPIFDLLTLNMLSPDYSWIWRKGHSSTYDVTNLHVSRFLWRATYRVWIDLSTGLSKFWLMRMRQVKCCTFLHGNCIKNLLQCQKVHF